MTSNFLTHFVFATTVTTLSLAGATNRAVAQSYQIDCAILLCLSGGWPASVPCARARAEFIRRITPWPVEPPLQIWRCPMGVSYDPTKPANSPSRVYDILLDDEGPLPQSYPEFPIDLNARPLPAVLRTTDAKAGQLPNGFALRLVQDRADIDISGPEFNFVRSIRVFDVRYARQYESSRDGDCNRIATVVLGTYGMQGDFSWARSTLSALPESHIGLERWGQNCPSIYHRSVYVDWQDFEGNYGFEQVDY
jgi:hypothetical protein